MPTLTSLSLNTVGRFEENGIRDEEPRNGMSRVAFLPIRIDEKNIESGAIDVLREVRPQWSMKIGESKIKSKVFTEGLSNKLVGFFVEDNKEDIVIVKVFGTNTAIDRQAEIETMRLLYERNCGAELYATFENGICYEYMNGITLEVEHCQDPKIYSMVAAEMARMHSDIGKRPVTNQNGNSLDESDRNQPHLFMNGITTSVENGINNHSKSHYQSRVRHHKSQMWNKLRQFDKLAEGIIATDPAFRARLERIGVTSGWGAKAITQLQSILESEDMPVTFCHNDLLPRNIVFDEKRNKITFIDVEYAMYNYAAFDVANHFLEFAGVEQIDYSKYPDQQFRYCWLQQYLNHLKVENISDEPITVEKFDFWVQKCVPLSHLLWGLWGIYQANNSTIEFDYVGYVELRLSEFQKHMKTL